MAKGYNKRCFTRDKQKQEAAQMGNEAKYGSGQATEFDTDGNRIGREILTSQNLAPWPSRGGCF